ncbi:DEAD/DEAH box helicase [Paraneptunicella aestuarii]|uniref:DEAD/DEAH box helicase n=1 Tax=Paraneptunicella aestuarii TaxID=2831148 RepID=UPI001E2B9904|nr:DEAD/DEAH box helicase [Paraneptunicella aestuarii]UAA40148.1 DEAD/DEAH box helicase [Paraneptunicella aestuarii]
MLAAHSPPKERLDSEPHSYSDHIAEAIQYGLPLIKDMLRFSHFDSENITALCDTLKAAYMLHDMGKLDELNQPVLKGEVNERLQVDHIDAGIAIANEINNLLLAWLIRGHHAPGLPSYDEECGVAELLIEECPELNLDDEPHLRGARHNRTYEHSKDVDLRKHVKVISRTDNQLANYKQLQIQECGEYPQTALDLPESCLTTRLMLSCLVDADHLSAACYESGEAFPIYTQADNRWEERLQALDKYVSSLAAKSKEPDSERNTIRGDFYRCCVESPLVDENLVSCSAPVGLGKTTSVMAFLLRQALAHGLRRIIVIAPFTNVINQTVKTLKKSIVLEGEDPDQVVVAHHHKADFSDKSLRQLSALWKAPIVVTTAVQFFETLASANPSQLRKLNSVPGSGIFVDESHACLPPQFLRVAWKWLRELSDDWGCRIVLSSGSMVEFWDSQYLVDDKHRKKIPELIDNGILARALELEKRRVTFETKDAPMPLSSLVEAIIDKGTEINKKDIHQPCVLVIMNTVQSAAVVADAIAKGVGQDTKQQSLDEMLVLHLSTALDSEDRDIILNEVECRQKNGSEWQEQTWYLVATSCVEAGVDLDFAVGFRERASVTSFLQVAGRINRHGFRNEAWLFDFVTVPDKDGLNHHPGFKEAQKVLCQLWDELCAVGNDLSKLSTRAITRELNHGLIEKSEALLLSDNDRNFQTVMDDFKVINTDTRIVIVDSELANKIECGVPVSWREVQKKSVQMWANKISKFNGFLSPINSKDELYYWNSKYDGKFLGFMAGVIETKDFFEIDGGVL